MENRVQLSKNTVYSYVHNYVSNVVFIGVKFQMVTTVTN